VVGAVKVVVNPPLALGATPVTTVKPGNVFKLTAVHWDGNPVPVTVIVVPGRY
jgi:hypothetical protein